MPENVMSNELLERRWVVSTLLESRENLLVISGLGAAVWDITAAGDHPLNFLSGVPWARHPRSVALRSPNPGVPCWSSPETVKC